jgi:hypothetical protein
MERRSFLTGLASVATLGGRQSLAATACVARLSVPYDEPGPPITADFIGLSYESGLLAGRSYFTPANRSLIGLIRRLGADGVLRIGGNTSERTVFWPGGEPGPADAHVIGPADIDRLAATLQQLQWRLIYGLNLARGTPQQAAAEAAYVMQAVGPRLLAFQIGNEPDGFGRWSEVRPPNYDFESFLSEWQPFHEAIRARLPDAPFAGPDVAAETGWVAAFARAAPAGLVLLTRHYYADGPASDSHVTLANLLRSEPQVEPILAALQRTASRFGKPYRIAETNSVFQGGRPGVSDTLGAALWGLELMFQVAAAGGAGINFHAGDDKVYTPIAGSGPAPHQARPLYYGMLLFAQGARGVLLPARLDPAAPGHEPPAGLRAFAAREGATLRVTLINKNAGRDFCVEIDPGAQFRRVSVVRLLGPSAEARSGVTLGGAAVDAFGGWEPSYPEPIKLAERVFQCDLPAASAALISFDT